MKLNIRGNKELEIKIVDLTDQLIQSVIAASLRDPEEKPLVLEEAEDLILQLSELIHSLIKDEQHLESMLNQLVFQKLPGDHILESFEDFNELLSTLIDKGAHRYRSSLVIMKEDLEQISNENNIDNCKNTIQVSNNLNREILNDNKKETSLAQDRLIADIKKLSPGLTVYKNISYKGTKFQYYIPEKKIALELQEKTKNSRRYKGIKEFITDKENITIIKIPTKYSISSLKCFLNFL